MFRFVIFRKYDKYNNGTPLVYSVRDGQQDALVARKKSQERSESNPHGSHAPWELVEISEPIFETGGAAKRAGKAKYW